MSFRRRGNVPKGEIFVGKYPAFTHIGLYIIFVSINTVY